MSKPTLVSVVIPAFNAAATIGETLQSVLSQSWQRLEIIVVDDGSVDATLDVIGSFPPGRIHVITQRRRGAAAARNAGLRTAMGKYIQFLDADDILSPAKVELQVKALEGATQRSVASCAWAHFQRDTSLAVAENQPVWRERDPIDWLVRSLSGEGMMQPACWLVPREVIDSAGPWNESLSLHDDGEFFTRVLLQSSGNVFVDDAMVYYRGVEGSLSRVRNENAIGSAFQVCEKRRELLLAARDDSRTRRALATQYAQFAYEFHAAAPNLSKLAESRIVELRAHPYATVGGRVFRWITSLAGFNTAMRLRSAFA